jgi:uroporphyrin-III C-methyltransferase
MSRDEQHQDFFGGKCGRRALLRPYSATITTTHVATPRLVWLVAALVIVKREACAFSVTSTAGRSSFSPLSLYIDDGSEALAQQPLVVSNEWGIPASQSLPPLAVYNGGTTTTLPRQLPNGGRVTLLGSGPGDPDLLTVAAHKLLTQADENTVIIVDRLVSKEILELISSRATVRIARKLPGCAELAQEEIYWWTHQALSAGHHVIRLKIGDPFVFGRGAEEVLQFRAWGVEASVLPGVSSAFCAPLLGQIPVTHRGVANQVVLCTGYGREGSSPDLIQYHPEQTIVFLMAVGRLADLCAQLQAQAHYPATTPVAIVERAGCPNQRTVVGTMTTIADIAKQHQVKPPSTIIVGEVVNVLLKDPTQEAISGLIQTASNVKTAAE